MSYFLKFEWSIYVALRNFDTVISGTKIEFRSEIHMSAFSCHRKVGVHVETK